MRADKIDTSSSSSSLLLLYLFYLWGILSVQTGLGVNTFSVALSRSTKRMNE